MCKIPYDQYGIVLLPPIAHATIYHGMKINFGRNQAMKNG
jgi:hypothetical protein